MPTQGNERLEVFTQLLGQLREPLLIASRDGLVRAANPASADALGTSVKALDGASLTSYSPDPIGLAAKLRRPSLELQVPMHARDGRRFSCDASTLGPDLLLVRLSGGVESKPRSRNLFDALSHLSRTAAASGQSLEVVTRALLTEGVQSVGALAGAIFLVDEARTNLELKASVFYPSEYSDRYRLIPLNAHLPITDTAKKGIPVFLEGSSDYADKYPEYAEAHPEIVRSGFASLPIEVDGSCIGALMIGFDTPAVFGASEREFLSFLALECAKAISRTREAPASTVTTQAEPAARRLERLHAFTVALAKAITPAQVVEAVVATGIAATSATSGELWLLSEDDADVDLTLSIGEHALRSEDFQHVRLDRPSRMAILDVVRDGAPVWIESRAQFEDQYPEAKQRASLACIPLLAQGRCIGGLAFGFDGAHPFPEDERAFLQVISWYSAQAIDRVRLYSAARRAMEEAEESKRRSDFIADIGTLLSASLDASDILQSVTQAAVPRVADWCIIKLLHDRFPTATFASHVSAGKTRLLVEMSDRISAMDNSAFGVALVMRTGEALHYPTLTMDLVRSRLGKDPSLVKIIAEVGIASAMVIPISARGSVLGAIILNRCTTDRAYDARDLSMAEELGRRIGLAIDNARLYQESREADRLKDEFLAMLSHELRNPLAPILTALELMKLRDDSIFPRERALISRHVQQVVRLVDDLLDVSRITRGKVQLAPDQCELAPILATALEMASPLANARRHRLTVVVPEFGLPLLADHARLAQAIGNVLTNAVKYTAPGGEIEVTAFADASDAVIRVRDTGIGMPPALVPRIFDLFVQGDASLDRTPGGLGIGLTVVRSILQMHGGSVSVHSDGPGRGSEFVLRIPLSAEEVPPAVNVFSERPPRPTTKSRRVMIVDDNHDAASLLGEALELLGWSVQVAHDGPSAITAIKAFRPQLGLLDIGLPGMDGYELARNLRGLDFGPSLRLIAVTGYGQASDRDRSRDAGFDEHIVKPVHLDTLRRVIEQESGRLTCANASELTTQL